MNRDNLETSSINELRALASRLGFDTRGARATILDLIINHYECTGWPEKFQKQSSSHGHQNPADNNQSTLLLRGETQELTKSLTHVTPQTTDLLLGARIMENSDNVGFATNFQYIIESVVQALQWTSASTSTDLPRQNSSHLREPLRNGNGSFIMWQQVKCAEKLISIFSGKEGENVVRWLQRIVNIARTYQFSDDTLLLAAVSQLKDRASNWYNRQPLESVSTWEVFKFQVRPVLPDTVHKPHESYLRGGSQRERRSVTSHVRVRTAGS